MKAYIVSAAADPKAKKSALRHRPCKPRLTTMAAVGPAIGIEPKKPKKKPTRSDAAMPGGIVALFRQSVVHDGRESGLVGQGGVGVDSSGSSSKGSPLGSLLGRGDGGSTGACGSIGR
jgi:hypothetical protein